MCKKRIHKIGWKDCWFLLVVSLETKESSSALRTSYPLKQMIKTKNEISCHELRVCYDP